MARLADGGMPVGYHEISWNGRNFNGNQVSSGVYFYRINAGAFQQVRKMMLLK